MLTDRFLLLLMLASAVRSCWSSCDLFTASINFVAVTGLSSTASWLRSLFDHAEFVCWVCWFVLGLLVWKISLLILGIFLFLHEDTVYFWLQLLFWDMAYQHTSTVAYYFYFCCNIYYCTYNHALTWFCKPFGINNFCIDLFYLLVNFL